ncbi:MAG TPA: hypothetical protein VLO13_02920 [Halomonas sp.]|nr:hypothetical protein [Halomonas sp.]
MITEQQYNVIVARLRGLASEAEMKRIFAKEKCSIPMEYRMQGERVGLLKALDLLTCRGAGMQ